MKRINKEQVVAVCVLATIILLFGSFLLESITLIAILVALAGMGATIFICEQKSFPLTFRNITSLFLCIILLGNLVTPAFATSEEATASIRYGYAENGNGRDLPIFLRDEINICVETYHLSPEMSDEDLANVYFMLDSQEAKDLWLKANIHLADAQNLSQEDANILASEENTQLCLRFYGVVKQIVETVPMVASTSGSLNGFNVTGGTTHDWVLSTGKIDITVKPRSEQQSDCSYKYYAQKDTLTLSATQSGTFMMQLDTKSSSTDTVKINGTTIPNGGNSGVLELETGDTVTISIEGTDNVSSNTTVSLSYSFTQQNSELSIIFKPASTPYTVNNTVIGSEEQEVKGTSFKVTVNSNNYVLTGATFVDNDQNSTFITAVGGILTPGTNGSITPIFGYDSDADNVSPFLVDKTTYWFWDDAVAAAQSSTKVVILNDDHTLQAGDYEVPVGITFLVPFDSANTLCTTSPATTETKSLTKPTAYRTLSMENGANIIVNGAISISGTQHAHMAQGTPFGPVGFIKMKSGSTITINSGANLYAWGYITGSGSVAVKSGGKVYECFQVADWRGGSATSSMVENQQRIFPLSQYYLQNVEVPMTLEPGAAEYAHMAVNVSLIGIQTSLVPFIGASDAMFKISEGTMTKRYDGSIDRLAIDLNESNLEISSYTISIKTAILGSVTLNSEDYVLPITSNMTLNVNSGSTIKLSQDIAVIPGCEINIEEGSVCTVTSNSSLYVYDSTDWGTYCGSTNKKFIPIAAAPGQKKTRTESDLVDAVVKVNGTLDASAGYIYTTSGSANIYSTGNGKIIQRAGNQTVTYQATYKEDGYDYHEIPITPAKLKKADGNPVETAEATTPTLYTYTNGTWIGTCVEHTEVTDAAVAPTCTATGLTEGKHCSVCGTVTVAQTEVPALGHTEVIDAAVAATCTTSGKTEGKHCSVCNTVTVAQTEVPALGHTEVTDAAKLPTYAEVGKTEGKHCSVCGEVLIAQQPTSAAQVGDITYLILKEAIAAGNNVTLLSNIDGTVPVNKEITIVKNGFNADVTAANGFALSETNGIVTVWKLIKIAGTSITAGDCLDIYFYVLASDLGDGDYYAEITRTKMTKNADGAYTVENTQTEEPIYRANWLESSGGYLRFCYKGIAGKEMTDVVSVTIKDSTGKQISATATESIQGYALRTLEKNKDTVLHTALVDMLNYGAAAQNHFGYRTGNLANAPLTEDQQGLASATPTLADKTEVTDNDGDGEQRLAGATVTAESNLYFTFYFKGISDKTKFSAEISYVDHYGNQVNRTVPGTNFNDYSEYCGPCVTGLAVADGKQIITCVLKENGTVVETVESSIESYAATTIAANSGKEGKENIITLCENLMRFVDSAYKYFHRS